MNETATMTETEKHELLREICVVLLMKQQVNRKQFFQAVEIVHDIARDCMNQCEALAAQLNKLKKHNTELSWTLNKVLQPINHDSLSH